MSYLLIGNKTFEETAFDNEDEIEKALNTLPEKCRTIFILYRFEDLSYQDVAKKMNISVNTVKTQMRRAFKKLREALKEYLPVFILFTFLLLQGKFLISIYVY